MRFCRLMWVERGRGFGLFSPWVFDRVRQDHRLGWLAWGVVCIRRCLLVLHHRRHVSESGRWRLLISHLPHRASDRRASAPLIPILGAMRLIVGRRRLPVLQLRQRASDRRASAPIFHLRRNTSGR